MTRLGSLTNNHTKWIPKWVKKKSMIYKNQVSSLEKKTLKKEENDGFKNEVKRES